MAGVLNTTDSMRATCMAVTMATPSSSARAVSVISAMPPGISPRMSDRADSPTSGDRTSPSPTVNAMLASVKTQAADSSRGAQRRKSGRYRSPNDHPMQS